MNFSKIGKLYEALYTDRMDITSTEETTDEDGATVNGYPSKPQQVDVPCRISLSGKDTPLEPGEMINKVETNPLVFCSTNVQIKTGDKIVVRRLTTDGVVYDTYRGAISAKPAKFETHQQVEIRLEVEA